MVWQDDNKTRYLQYRYSDLQYIYSFAKGREGRKLTTRWGPSEKRKVATEQL